MTGKIAFAGLFLSAFACSPGQQIEWVSTTNDQSWVTETQVSSRAGETVIEISPDSASQSIEGFGGCFNELGWDALQALPEEKRKEVLKNLFDTISGCRFNIFRMPIGANDYAVDWYSLDETPEDFEMKNFSLDRDKKKLIPYIKVAQSFIPDLKIWASPWCPPSWMKSNHHYACASDPKVNDLPADKQGEEMVTQFRMEPKVLSAYALYFKKFIQGYAAEGIPVSAVHVQNEMNSCQNFPSCIWRPEDLATFIGKYLGPQFESNGLTTQIWYGTVERPQIARVDTVLQNPEAARYIKGVGFQWAGKGAIPEVHRKYANLKLMQTETECGNGSNDWAAAEHTFELMKHYFKNGANAYMYWNMILDETGKSQWGWKQNSMISIEKTTGKVTYHPEYYLMKHLSYFVKPGSKYIPVNGDENCLAFVKGNQLVIFYYNADETEKETTFKIGEMKVSVKLQPKSFNTLKFLI
jgi:glucosylceramidase